MQQLCLLGGGPPNLDPKFTGLRRDRLSDEAWVDHLPGWVSGHVALFEALVRDTRWSHAQRVMYERIVEVPRLTAGWPADAPDLPMLHRLRELLGARYGVVFQGAQLSLYRDGRDSVAYHQDRELKLLDRTLVAIVAIGTPRRFQLRPVGGGPSRSYASGWGDLLVMGGSCQRDFEHGIPKVAPAGTVGPRISIIFRAAPQS